MGNKDIYQHYRPEDYLFIDRSVEMAERIIERYSFEVTSFLNPHQIAILRTIAARFQLQVFVAGDFYPMEYSRVLVAPEYYQLDEADFEIGVLELTYANKFHDLRHAQVLGTLLHQLGIDRKSFGDIIVTDGKIQILVERRFVSYFMDHLDKIGRVPVKIQEGTLAGLLKVEEETHQKEILVSSFRLDKLVAATFKLSRSQADQLIRSGQVKVNYAVVDASSVTLRLDDLVSVRRHGRFRLHSDNGVSKSGKHKLTVEVLFSKK